MTQYLLSVYYPEGGTMPDPETLAQISANLEVAERRSSQRRRLGVRGRPLSAQHRNGPHSGGGEVLVTDGPYVESKEVLGGFSIIEAPDLDAALDWGRRMAEAITVPIEVRPIQSE